MDFDWLLEMKNKNSGFANNIGIEISEIKEGYAVGILEIEDRHLNHNRTVHGGCIMTLMDTVGGAAAISHGYNVTTSGCSVSFLNPAVNTKTLRAVSKEIKFGNNLAVYDIFVYDDKETLIGKSTFTFFKLESL